MNTDFLDHLQQKCLLLRFYVPHQKDIMGLALALIEQEVLKYPPLLEWFKLCRQTHSPAMQLLFFQIGESSILFAIIRNDSLSPWFLQQVVWLLHLSFWPMLTVCLQNAYHKVQLIELHSKKLMDHAIKEFFGKYPSSLLWLPFFGPSGNEQPLTWHDHKRVR